MNTRGRPKHSCDWAIDATNSTFRGLFLRSKSVYCSSVINLALRPENIETISKLDLQQFIRSVERILSHWMNLDQREPTLKIVCPKPLQDIAKPTYAIVNCGTPFSGNAHFAGRASPV